MVFCHNRWSFISIITRHRRLLRETYNCFYHGLCFGKLELTQHNSGFSVGWSVRCVHYWLPCREIQYKHGYVFEKFSLSVNRQTLGILYLATEMAVYQVQWSLYKDHPRDQQDVDRWSLYSGSITWKVYPCGPVKCGFHKRMKQVVFIYRWSLEQIWLYSVCLSGPVQATAQSVWQVVKGTMCQARETTIS